MEAVDGGVPSGDGRDAENGMVLGGEREGGREGKEDVRTARTKRMCVCPGVYVRNPAKDEFK